MLGCIDLSCEPAVIPTPLHLCAGAWLLGALLSGLLLAQLTQGLQPAALWNAASRVPADTWAVASLAWVASLGLRALRLRREWSAGPRIGFVSSLRLVALHGAALTAMPVRLGEIGYVFLLYREWQVNLGRAVRSLIWSRWQDATVLLAIAAALLPPIPAGGRWSLALAILLTGVVILPALGPRLWSHVPALRRWRWAVAEHPADVAGWSLCLANWALRIGALWLLLSRLLPDAAALQPAVAVAVELSHILPVQGVGGLGSYEAAAWSAARLHGVDTGPVVVAALVLHLHAAALHAGAAAAAWAHGRRDAPAHRPTLAGTTSDARAGFATVPASQAQRPVGPQSSGA